MTLSPIYNTALMLFVKNTTRGCCSIMQYPLYRIDSFFFLLCYIPKSSTQVCTVSSETPEENLSPSNQFPVPAASANNSPLSPKPELEKVQKGTTVFPVKSFASINLAGGSQRFFRCEPSEVSKNERMKFIALKTKDGELKGNIAFYCRFALFLTTSIPA